MTAKEYFKDFGIIAIVFALTPIIRNQHSLALTEMWYLVDGLAVVSLLMELALLIHDIRKFYHKMKSKLS